jgi:hypothetical protein
MASSALEYVSPAADAGSKVAEFAARLAIAFSVIAILLLAALHILSPEFAPSWRMISEYAFGRYGWVLSLMFLFMGAGPWALSIALWSQAPTRTGKVGLWFLLVSGLGGAMASYFDIHHEIGHGIAGLLGVLGFPVAALLISISLGRNESWRNANRGLFWLAHLSWISIVLLAITLAIMTVQVSHAYGGHLPQHAPKSLPPGVLALDGWADRLIVLSNCAWVLLAGWQSLRHRRERALRSAKNCMGEALKGHGLYRHS